MGKNLDPKCKQCRREGEKLFLKGERCYTSKCAIVKRNFIPGMHGNKRKPRLSGYGLQLREKQKAKRQYGILEKQFRLYYEKAKKKSGQTGEMMLVNLESRLDNVVYRALFATSRSAARQLASHGNFQVNGQNVNIPSLALKEGDVITVKSNKTKNKYWSKLSQEESATAEVPAWLIADKTKLQITVVKAPTVAAIQSNLQMHLIVELYSL